MTSPSAGAPALKYGDVNTVTPTTGDVKGLMILDLMAYLFVLLHQNLWYLIDICN